MLRMVTGFRHGIDAMFVDSLQLSPRSTTKSSLCRSSKVRHPPIVLLDDGVGLVFDRSSMLDAD